MGVTRFARPGGPRQSSDEGSILARHQVLDRGFDLVRIGELAQSIGARNATRPEFAAAQQQHANDAEFLFRNLSEPNSVLQIGVCTW